MGRNCEILKIREVLEKKRKILRNVLAGDLNLLKNLRFDQSSRDSVDEALDSLETDVSLGLAEAESQELENIEAALNLIQAGKYGSCIECGANIPLERLRALPCASRCIACQIVAEQKGNGHDSKPSFKLVKDIDERLPAKLVPAERF